MFLSPDDLASKANIIIDPAEIQSTSMDDLDEDEESGATQVCVCVCLCALISSPCQPAEGNTGLVCLMRSHSV